jgi:HK97 family phage prohead protease
MTDKRTFLRAFPSTIERTGPRQLTGRLVPYGVVTDVGDELPDGSVEVYREGFKHGAFSPQAKLTEPGVLSKISLIHRHNGGLGYLGPFTALREEQDGLYGDVTVLRSKADDVEDLLSSGVDDLSVEFRLPKSGGTEVDSEGTRWRTRAHLDQVALEAKGAYPTAQVLAYRAEAEEAAEAARAAQEALEAEAARQLARHARWADLAARLDGEAAKQEEYLRRFGVTKPEGYRRP